MIKQPSVKMFPLFKSVCLLREITNRDTTSHSETDQHRKHIPMLLQLNKIFTATARTVRAHPCSCMMRGLHIFFS